MVYLGYLLLYLANNYIYNELNLIAKFIFASFIVIGFVNVIDVWGEWGILNKYFTFVKEKLGVIFIFFWPYFMVTYQITSNKFDFMLLLVLFLLMMLFRKYFDVWFAKLQQNENMFFKWLNKFVLFMFWVSIIFVSVAFIGYILFTPTDIDVCIDYVGVWDYYENRCRFDCTSWTKESGCVKIEK